MTSKVRPIPSGAAPALSLLHRACFPEEPWETDALERILMLSGTFGFCVWQGDLPVGFVLARDLGGETEILSIGVLPERRRSGLARALLGAVFAEAERRGGDSVVLEVADDNAPARRLYAGLGFVAIGRRPRYYSRGSGLIDGLILRCRTRGRNPQPRT
ncbi:MAG TPA: GNAT family N-acetyltransferase [Stellaceae bacterium]